MVRKQKNLQEMAISLSFLRMEIKQRNSHDSNVQEDLGAKVS